MCSTAYVWGKTPEHSLSNVGLSFHQVHSTTIQIVTGQMPESSKPFDGPKSKLLK